MAKKASSKKPVAKKPSPKMKPEKSVKRRKITKKASSKKPVAKRPSPKRRAITQVKPVPKPPAVMMAETAEKRTYARGDRVKCTVDIGPVRAGTVGTVVRPIFEEAAEVLFEGQASATWVNNEDLEPA